MAKVESHEQSALEHISSADGENINARRTGLYGYDYTNSQWRRIATDSTGKLLGGAGSINNPFPSTGFYMYDTDGNLWKVTIDNTGHLTTTFGEPAGGEIFGLWSFLPRTYSE